MRKKKQVEEKPQPTPEQEPEPAPPAPESELGVEDAPRTQDVIATKPEPAAQAASISPPTDDELPPPPTDIKESTKDFLPIKTRKPGAGAALKRAGAIFGKDARTIAKHGLISSVILLVFLLIVFYISSYAMFMFVTTGFGEEGGNGDGNKTGENNGPNLGNDGSLVASAGSDRTISAGALVTLDSSGSTHEADIMYVEWRIENQNKSNSGDQSTVYGPTAQYRFYEVGKFTVRLTVVDSRWNLAEANFTVTVNPDPSTSDTTPPVPLVNGTGGPGSIQYGTPVFLDASNSTDNIGIVNWTWTIRDMIQKTVYGAKVSYTFYSTGDKQMTLVVRDAAGNTGTMGGSMNVMSSDPSDNNWPSARMGDLPKSVNTGDTVTLDASPSNDDRGIMEYVWYVQLNNTITKLKGMTTSFVASGFGQYQITLIVKDAAGNANMAETGVMSLVKGMKEPSMVTWMSTPLGQDIPFNVLTFTYGASLLASVIFLGGLFAKGFAYEVQKGTAKTLFFAPISVTNMIFAKLLYPLIIAPFFMFPLLLISLIPLQQDPVQVLEIAAVSYVMTALVLISAVYGSCMIYALTKRMSLKPTVVARSFMYLSLVGTLAIFAGLSFLMDNWFNTDTWNRMSEDIGPSVAMFSPFHQGGLLLQSVLLGSPLSLDWIVFVVPIALIVGGILASRKLYGDIFSRE